MVRKLTEKKLLLATGNPGKVKEMREILAPYGVDVSTPDHVSPEETGSTFAENAAIKALTLARDLKLPVLADDSGLCVHALDNRPGLYSARSFEADTKGFKHAAALLNAELKEKTDRSAHFSCAVALAWPDGHVETFSGEVKGAIVDPPRGDKGFGYDPVFLPDGSSQTFAEMGAGEKHKISHRARALRAFVEGCLTP